MTIMPHPTKMPKKPKTFHEFTYCRDEIGFNINADMIAAGRLRVRNGEDDILNDDGQNNCGEGINWGTRKKTYLDNEGLAYYTTKLLEKIRNEFYSAPFIEHKCQNCGGTVCWEADKHIFHCHFCGSVYVLGKEMINDNGRGKW